MCALRGFHDTHPEHFITSVTLLEDEITGERTGGSETQTQTEQRDCQKRCSNTDDRIPETARSRKKCLFLFLSYILKKQQCF